jgi:N-acetylmuramoyl-L-alanine amidase
MKIAVYAGHGGSDYGAVANGVYEKNINLALSNAVSENLKRMGYEVINNRVTDTDRNINRDAQLANSQRADALVEIHMNSNAGTPGTGSEAFISIRDTGKARALAENILSSLERLGFRNRGVKTRVNAAGADAFGILRLANMPSVLLETAFLNNPEDMGKLNIQKVAEAIAASISRQFPLPVQPVRPEQIIRNIQTTLNERYGFRLIVDGIAGPATRNAIVMGLQTELNSQFGRNLSVDGKFGPLTHAAAVNVRQGARGNMTYLIQAALFIRGYDSVVPDGAFGPITERAVRQFQGAAGLTVDGIAGPNTQQALFNWW